jgi:RNA polymerase sigma-70 factor (ECF subfamily)
MIDTEENKTKFELIYEKYHKLMFYIANQILYDSYLAEDAVHDSFVKIIENLDNIEEVTCHKTKYYIVTIVRNTSINLYNYRKNKAYIPIEEIEYELFVDTEFENSLNSELDNLGDLGRAIIKLPVMYRDIITLKFVYEFTYQEIADSLGITEVNARKRIERAKQKIEDQLEKEKSNEM